MAMRLKISDEMIETLKSHVSFGTRADLQDFVADAMNTYIQLAALVAPTPHCAKMRVKWSGHWRILDKPAKAPH